MVMMMRLLIIHDKRGRQSTAMKRVYYLTAAQTKKLTVAFKPAGITPIDSIVVDDLCCLSCDMFILSLLMQRWMGGIRWLWWLSMHPMTDTTMSSITSSRNVMASGLFSRNWDPFWICKLVWTDVPVKRFHGYLLINPVAMYLLLLLLLLLRSRGAASRKSQKG